MPNPDKPNPDKLDPLTADFAELRAMPHLNDAVYLSCLACSSEQCRRAWARAVNALMRTVPL